MRDIGKGLIVAILAAIVASLSAALNISGFDFATFDWGNLAKIGFTAGISYLVKNFFSADGKFLGAI